MRHVCIDSSNAAPVSHDTINKNYILLVSEPSLDSVADPEWTHGGSVQLFYFHGEIWD